MKAYRLAAVAVAAMMMSPLAALAGDGNVLYLSQDSSAGAIAGNSFSSDQYLANYSSIGSVGTPAIQSGDGNSARLTIAGNCLYVSDNCAHVDLKQSNDSLAIIAANQALAQTGSGMTIGSTLSGNTATISIDDHGVGAVSQIGDSNVALLEVTGGSNSGSIFQTGLDNSASLKVNAGVSGTVEQTGYKNSAAIEIAGTSGASVTLTQTGNNLSYGGGTPTPPITVTTTGDVTISQYNP